MKKYDLRQLKSVPILEVAAKLGISMIRTGGDAWQEKDGKETTSLTVFPGTNSFVRFSGKERGGKEKGSVIDFVMHVRDNPDFKAACEFLAKFL